jgi:hypothetical protein
MSLNILSLLLACSARDYLSSNQLVGIALHNPAQPGHAILARCDILLLQVTLPPDQQARLGDTVAVDIQAIQPWVKGNNPKQFIQEGRLDRTMWTPRLPEPADAL